MAGTFSILSPMAYRLLIGFVLSICLAAAGEDEAVRKVLDDQIAAWNRGDLVDFVEGYDENAVFVGTEISRGKAAVLARYRKTYDTAEKRGKLKFDLLEAKALGAEHYSVIGRFHLTRGAAGGGDAKGIFNLIFRKTSAGWKIILDHTS